MVDVPPFCYLKPEANGQKKDNEGIDEGQFHIEVLYTELL